MKNFKNFIFSAVIIILSVIGMVGCSDNGVGVEDESAGAVSVVNTIDEPITETVVDSIHFSYFKSGQNTDSVYSVNIVFDKPETENDHWTAYYAWVKIDNSQFHEYQAVGEILDRGSKEYNDAGYYTMKFEIKSNTFKNSVTVQLYSKYWNSDFTQYELFLIREYTITN